MDKKRREFLKIAGISTLAGLGAPAVVDRIVTGAGPLVAHAATEVATGHGTAAEGGGHGDSHAADGGHGAETVKSGNRWGMVIDVKKFYDNPAMAEACVNACHKVHNVPDFPEKKDEIKWIWQTDYNNAFTEHSHYYKDDETKKNKVLVLCNHCDNPPCVRACPTKATFQNKDGIVAMDYHRCIGCRFCMAACPYGSRSFNWRDPREAANLSDPNKYTRSFPTRMRGVVEKCNFCVERLGRGEEPACVETAAASKAIVFGNLNDPNSEIRKVLKENYTIQRKPSLGTHPSVFYIV